MYKLIIVEDEDIVRSGLKNGTDWNSLGFEVVGTASNGIEALELVNNSEPDVVLTDIRMPDMDGIELMRILKHRNPDIEIIILSGYSDFEYARNAVKYNAFAYLTKPIDEIEFTRTFREVRQKIREKRQSSYILKNIGNEDKNLNGFIIRELFLSTLLTKRLDEEFIRKSLKELDININEKNYCIAVVQMDCDYSETDPKTVDFIRNICQQHIVYYGYPHVFMENSCFIILSRYGAAYYDFIRDIHMLKEGITTGIDEIGSDITVSIGVSNIHTGFSSIIDASKEAQTALRFKFYLGGNRVIAYNSVTSKKLEANGVQKLEELISKLVEAVINHEHNERAIITNNLFNFIKANALSDITFIRIKFMEVFVVLDNKLKQRNISLRILSSKETIYEEIFNIYTLDILREWFRKKLEAIDADLTKYSAESDYSIAKQVQKYILENIKNKIYLEDIADAVHMSPNYLSTAFKRETGLNLSKYITEMKINKAKEYLAFSDMRIQDIAEELGFSDYRYFCTVFKSETGQTPLSFRAENHR